MNIESRIVTSEYKETNVLKLQYGEIIFKILVDFVNGEYWRAHYIRVDCREYTSEGNQYYYYDTEKQYRAAIKRWSKKVIK